jgi:hypothetical protein
MSFNGAVVPIWVFILLLLLLSSSMFPSAFLCALLLFSCHIIFIALEIFAEVVGLAGTAICFGCMYVYFAY